MSTPRALALALALSATVLGGCGSAEKKDPPPPAKVVAKKGADIKVTYNFPDRKTVRFRCLTAGSYQGIETCDPAKLKALDRLLTDAAGDTRQETCTQVYGGPETVDVEGTVQTNPVKARFTRSNGCDIRDYDKLMRAIGGKPLGAAKPLDR